MSRPWGWLGIWLTNLAADGVSAPPTRTNISVTDNRVRNDKVNNGLPYQAGIADVGNNDKIIGNEIRGAGYFPATVPGSAFAIDTSGAISPHVRDNETDDNDGNEVSNTASTRASVIRPSPHFIKTDD